MSTSVGLEQFRNRRIIILFAEDDMDKMIDSPKSGIAGSVNGHSLQPVSS